MSDLPFERLFTMAAFEALRIFRSHAAVEPGGNAIARIGVIRKIDPDYVSLDFEAALQLHELIDAESPHDTPRDFYRACIFEVLITEARPWNRAVNLGRNHLLNQLTRDQHQCFRAAVLLDVPPTPEIVVWWDLLSSKIRQAKDEKKLAQARKAELLSFQFEQARLKRLGIDREPEWTSIDDNTAGYDIKSYDAGPAGPISRVIEVKSTTVSPLKFIISRNEWDQAIKLGSSYVFHVWYFKTPSPILYEIPSGKVQGHIPGDSALGKWKSAEIPVGPLVSGK